MPSPPQIPPPFLERLKLCLSLSDREFAKLLGVPLTNLRSMMRSQRVQLADLDRDEAWLHIWDLTSMKLGELLAVREELDRKLHYDRRERMKRQHRIINR